MGDNIIKLEPTDIQREAGTILDVISRAAMDPTVDVVKLERLLAIQERLLSDQRRTSFMAAMARLQERLPQITKAGTILGRDGEVRTRYARIEDIDVAIRPLCAEEGFSFSVDSKPVPGGSEYSCTLSHRDGHSEVKTLVLPVDSGGHGRSAVQNAGSSLSYARRYLIMMHLNLVTRGVDNDGAGEVAPITAEQVTELRSKLAEVGGSEARFLVWLKVAAFEDIPSDKFGPAMMFIAEKRKAAAK